MGELTNYRLSDFILFSQTAYYRQFELYNHAIWPLHLVAILFSVAIFYALWKKPAWAGRLIAVLLVMSWLWVAWAFLYQRFYQIHVVANWYAWGFILQAGLITWYGVIKNGFDVAAGSQYRIVIGCCLLFITHIVYPFIPLLNGRSWKQFEMFALAPDPTALATIAILLLYRSPRLLYFAPIVWVIISGVTLFVI
jgi:hypothetical protein